MSDRNPNGRRPGNEANGIDWGNVLRIGVAVAGGVAAAALLFNALDIKDSARQPSTALMQQHYTPPQLTYASGLHNFNQPSFISIENVSDEKEELELELVVDATPKKGGGLLIVSGGETKTLYYYSVNWTEHLKFPAVQVPDKMELANALLALNYFQKMIPTWSVKSFVVKLDNEVVKKTEKYKDKEGDEKMWEHFQEFISKYQAKKVYVVKEYDQGMKIADELSRNRTKDWMQNSLRESYTDFSLVDCSWNVETTLKDFAERFVAEKYWKRQKGSTTFSC